MSVSSGGRGRSWAVSFLLRRGGVRTLISVVGLSESETGKRNASVSSEMLFVCILTLCLTTEAVRPPTAARLKTCRILIVQPRCFFGRIEKKSRNNPTVEKWNGRDDVTIGASLKSNQNGDLQTVDDETPLTRTPKTNHGYHETIHRLSRHTCIGCLACGGP